jgi:hypothetical protein
MKWYKTIIHPPRHWNRWLSLDSVWCSWGKVGWHRTWAGRYCDPRRANGPLRQAPAICTAPFKTLKGLLGLGEIGRATPKAWVILPSSGDFGGMEWLKHVDSFQNPWSNSWMVNIYIYIDSKILNVCTWLGFEAGKNSLQRFRCVLSPATHPSWWDPWRNWCSAVEPGMP